MNHPHRTLPVLLSTLLLTLAACAPTPPKPAPRPTAQAEALEAQGNLPAAIQAWLDLAATPGPNAQRYRLRALALTHENGDFPAAEALYEQIDERPLDASDTARYRLLGADLATREQRWDQVLQRLPVPAPRGLDRQTRLRYHQTRRTALMALNDAQGLIQEKIRLYPDINDPQQAQSLLEQILDSLAPLTEAERLRLLNNDLPLAQAWRGLADVLSHASGDPAQIDQELTAWRSRFPAAPFNDPALRDALLRLAARFRLPTRIAVLLPLQGRFATAASAIRDGIISAWLQTPAEQRPEIQFHDSHSADSIQAVYQQAVDDGAEWVIGPLAKQAVATLTQSGPLTVPTLALNRVQNEAPIPPNMVQFALLPEDEARQIARHLQTDQQGRALLLLPKNRRGERLATALTEALTTQDGRVLERQDYDPKATDFGAPIKALLNIDDSEKRRRALSNILGERPEFEPRRRQDAQSLVFTASARQGRILFPQLRFHRAGDLPTIATSRVDEGLDESERNRDMDGLHFPDLPWFLHPGEFAPITPAQARELWPQRTPRYLRLFAVGLDAYRAIQALPSLHQDPAHYFAGATGRLHLIDSTLQGTLEWAHFAAGHAVSDGFPKAELPALPPLTPSGP